jgi:cold-inducible RNA-binding protein
MAAKLFVGNLEYTVTAEELRNHFLSAGNITDCVVIVDKMTGRSRGFGFVEFETDEQAKKAVESLNGSDLKGRNITVSEARPQEARPTA